MLSSLRSSVLTLGLAVFALPAHAFDTTARAAYVMDQTTGTVLTVQRGGSTSAPRINVKADDALCGVRGTARRPVDTG